MKVPVERNLETSPTGRLQAEHFKAKRRIHAPHSIESWELDLAVQVHQSLLPEVVQHPRIDISFRYLPVDGVGGDYCQILFPDEDTCCISICDVMGHGFGATLLATRVSSEVRTMTFQGLGPGEITGRLNTFLLRHFDETEQNVSFFAARIDLKRRTMVFSGAGHPSQLLFRSIGDRVEPLVSQNMLLGITGDGLADQPEDKVRLAPGDRLLCFTDGLTDGILFAGGLPRVFDWNDVAKKLQVFSTLGMIDHFIESVWQLDRGTFRDDVTLVAAEIK